jgi:endogenous inhibitor of DNA gyrase (YacG/DUF329 family)
MEILITCPFCGSTHSVTVNMNDWFDYQNGKLAQNAFPYLNPTEREQLISNMCPACQKKVFGE